MASVSSFYSASDLEAVLKHSSDNVENKFTNLSAAELLDEFDINKTAEWINRSNFKRVALQFPDELLHVSVPVTRLLMSQCTNALCVILADTKYGSCCVDEVAAQHYNVDAIVHYGHACLSPVVRVPVLHVFGRSPIDVSDCVQQIQTLITSSAVNPDDHVLVLYDVIYHHASDEMSEKLSTIFKNLIVPSLIMPSCERKSTTDASSESCSETCKCRGDASVSVGSSENSDVKKLEQDECKHSITDCCSAKNQTNSNCCSSKTECCNKTPEFSDLQSKTQSEDNGPNVYCRFNRIFTLPDNINLSDCMVLYIGSNNLFQSALMMTLNQCKFITYDPELKRLTSDAWNMNRMLMKRYYMVEKARDAARVGILVGTLGVKDYLEVIRRLSSLIRHSGKKCYRFVVGKLNEAKLANFAEIDVFVLIACPENSLIDSSDLYRPVVTPFEMELACQPHRQWTGSYQLDFRQLLPGGDSYESCDHVAEVSGARMDVSLITGRVRQIGVDESSEQSRDKNMSGAIMTQDGRILVHNSAGDFLTGRSWQGLDPRLGETSVGDVVEGLSGLAAEYSHEPK